MTILKRSQTSYVVEVKHSRWWLLATAVCLWLALSLILDGTIITLTCHRIESNDGQCEYSRHKLLDNNTQTFRPDQVTEATLYTTLVYTDRNKRSHEEYHVALVLDGTRSLEIYADTDLSAQETLVDNINGYLANPGRVDLNVMRDESTGNSAIGLLIATCSLWWASVVLKTTTFTFDKSVGTLTIQSRLIWARLKTYSLAEILGLHVSETESYTIHRCVHLILRGEQQIATNLPANNDDLIQSLHLFLSKTATP